MPENIFAKTPPIGQFYCDACNELEMTSHVTAVLTPEVYHFCIKCRNKILGECTHCSSWHLNRSLRQLTASADSDQKFCTRCAEQLLLRCNGCQKEDLRENSVEIGSVDGPLNFCHRCIREHTFTCPSCNLPRQKTNRANVWLPGSQSTQAVCQVCAINNFTRCQDCNAGYTESDPRLRYHEQLGANICDLCRTRRGSSSNLAGDTPRSVIQNYSTKINVGKFGNPADKIYFGVELEVEVNKHYATEVQNDFKKFVILKQDSSVPNGFEIVSAPATLEAHKEKWSPFFKRIKYYTALKKANMRSWHTTTCGMHIHISRREKLISPSGRWDGRSYIPLLSELQIAKMQQFIHKDANWDFIKKIAGRDPNQFCKWDYSKRWTDGINGIPNRSEGHRTALNLGNTETVELRIFKGTLKPESFFKNLEFAKALVEFTKPMQNSISTFKGPSYEAFLTWLAMPANRKAYPNLVAFIIRKGKKVDERYAKFFSSKQEKEHILHLHEKKEVYDDILPPPTEEAEARPVEKEKRLEPFFDMSSDMSLIEESFRDMLRAEPPVGSSASTTTTRRF